MRVGVSEGHHRPAAVAELRGDVTPSPLALPALRLRADLRMTALAISAVDDHRHQRGDAAELVAQVSRYRRQVAPDDDGDGDGLRRGAAGVRRHGHTYSEPGR